MDKDPTVLELIELLRKRRTADIVALYKQGWSREAIGKRHNITHQRVGQILRSQRIFGKRGRPAKHPAQPTEVMP